MYLLARLLVKRRYREPLTLGMVAKALASSPRQVQRVYAQFGSATFRDDLLARRMVVAAELLSLPAIQVREVARQVGYRKPSFHPRVPVHLRRATNSLLRRPAPGKGQRNATMQGDEPFADQRYANKHTFTSLAVPGRELRQPSRGETDSGVTI